MVSRYVNTNVCNNKCVCVCVSAVDSTRLPAQLNEANMKAVFFNTFFTCPACDWGMGWVQGRRLISFS